MPRSATSNTVQTIVQQVGSFTLVSDTTRLVAPGGQVVFPHTLTNTGNGSDTFTLTSGQALNGVTAGTASDNFNLNNFAIYADADGNGVADNAIDLSGTTVTLAAGPTGVFKFVVVGSAPGTQIAGDDAITTVTATNSAPNTVTAAITNTDVATITADAVINVTKSANVVTGPTGTVVQYTLTYTNTGNNTATNVNITDVIPSSATPATIGGMKYVANSGVWSAGGTLTDTNGAADDGTTGINYSVSGTDLAGDRTVTAVITSVGPNVSGTLKFSVIVDDTPATGVGNDGNSKARPGTLTNTANFTYHDGTNPVASQPTNSVNFLVTQTADVAANDSLTLNTLIGDDNTVNVTTANQGTTVSFSNIIWNNGNGADSFAISYANAGGGNGFPAGTSFQLFQADGVNVLPANTTPVIQPGQSYTVVLKATLPAGALPGNNLGNKFTVVKTATSITDPTKSDFVNDTLDNITANVVDLSNNTTPTPNSLGAGGATDAGTVDNGGLAWSTPPGINPGASVTFPLLIENKVGIADNYDLAAGSTVGMAALPAGWTVVFRAAGTATSCATVGATITNTGTINAAGSRLVCAVVSTPTTQIPTTQNVFFKVTSPVSNATDTKKDAVKVNTYRNLSMVTDRTGQVFPGGSVVYEHILTNNGNVTEGDAGTEMLITGVNSLSGFTTVLYIDTNNNGVLDVTDQAINGVSGSDNFQTVTVGTTGTGLGNGLAGLSPGESVRIFAKVQSPANATPGTTDAATITANVVGVVGATLPLDVTAAPADPVNTDTTNVIGGQIRLDKTQALDKNCNGTIELGLGDVAYTNSNLSALPGQCIMYSILATNEGVSPVTGIIINDTTPQFTTLSVAPAPTVTTAGAGVASFDPLSINTNGATGALIANVTLLNGAETATLKFSVKIDQ